MATKTKKNEKAKEAEEFVLLLASDGEVQIGTKTPNFAKWFPIGLGVGLTEQEATEIRKKLCAKHTPIGTKSHRHFYKGEASGQADYKAFERLVRREAVNLREGRAVFKASRSPDGTVIKVTGLIRPHEGRTDQLHVVEVVADTAGGDKVGEASLKIKTPDEWASERTAAMISRAIKIALKKVQEKRSKAK